MSVLKLIRSMMREKSGNFAIVAAVVLPVIAGVVGATMDISRMVTLQSHTQGAADAATLIVTKRLVEDDITEAEATVLAHSMFVSQMYQGKSKPADVELVPIIKIEKTKTNGKIQAVVEISAKGKIKKTMPLKLFGGDNWSFDTKSKSDGSSETKSALSMFLVLDRSGSMSWDGRMVALKSAVTSLMNQLDEADVDGIYVRTGAVSYNHYTQNHKKLAWGTDHTNSYVQALPASGGTDSSNAVKKAYMELKKGKEKTAHKKKNGDTDPSKIIVFMTDGSNNESSSDTSTIKWCKNAKKKGIMIFTVAFQAPIAGQQLLSTCATDASYYFEADNAQALFDAFKAIGAKAANMMVVLKN